MGLFHTTTVITIRKMQVLRKHIHIKYKRIRRLFIFLKFQMNTAELRAHFHKFHYEYNPSTFR